jgi:hypothetical protein
MKNYSELRATKQQLNVLVSITSVGKVGYTLLVNDKVSESNFLHPLLEPISFAVVVNGKDYAVDSTSLVTIESLNIDGIELIPKFNHLTEYTNDQQSGLTTNCLGFNGTWKFNIDRPFYQWLHQVTNQGWLLQPTS